MKHILTIDGGGIRGIIPAKFCVELEKLINSSDDESNVTRLSDVFNLIAGTSTGGIIALALAKSTEDKSKTSVAEDILNLYRNKGHIIFSKPRRFPLNLFSPKYAAGALEKALKDYFGETKLGQAKTHVLVTYYDLATRSARSLTSWDNPDCLMSEAARATSAAPTYFSPAFLKKSPNSPFIDGGVFANNPAGVAYLAAQKRFPKEDMLFVAVGTGTLVEPPATMSGIDPRGFVERAINLFSLPRWGFLNWAPYIFTTVFDGVSDFTDEILRTLLPDKRYYRMQKDIGRESEKLDRVDHDNIVQLESYGTKMFEEHRVDLDTLVPLLKEKSLDIPKSRDAILTVFSKDDSHADPEKVQLIKAAVKLLPRTPEIFKLEHVKQLDDTNLSSWHGIFLPIPYHQGFDERLIDRLVAWVRDGGRLVITGYELGERHHATNINQLVWNFGLRFNSDIVVGPDSPEGAGIKPYNDAFFYDRFPNRQHPLLKGVESICARNACSLNLDPGSEPLVSIAPNKIRDFNPEDATYTDPDLDGIFELSSPLHMYGKAYEDRYRSLMAIAPAKLTGKGSVLAIGTWDFRPDENLPKDSNNEIFISNIWNWLCTPK